MQHLLEKIKQLWIGLELNQSKDLINEEWVAKLIKSAVKRNTNGNHAYYYNMHIHYLLISDSFDLHSQVFFSLSISIRKVYNRVCFYWFYFMKFNVIRIINFWFIQFEIVIISRDIFQCKNYFTNENAIILFIVVSVKNKQIYAYRALLSGWYPCNEMSLSKGKQL